MGHSHGEQYIHGHGAAVLANHSRRTAENSAPHLLPRLRPGMRLLDVGCGPGTVTAGLAARVAPGEVIGVDREASVLPDFSDGGEHHGIEPAENLSFQVCDAYALPFEDASFDVAHAHQILHHLSDPVAAIREMARVVRPGGIVSLREADYGAMTWYPAVPGLDGFIAVFREQGRLNDTDLDAGRKLYAWALEAGLSDVEPSAGVWSFATPQEREFWAGSWAERVLSSSFSEQAIASGSATLDELHVYADAWRTWAAADGGWFMVPHGQVIARP